MLGKIGNGYLMRPNNQNGKRSRGRGRRSNGFNQPNVNRNTTFESNGPDGKLRGNAQQLYEKYTALAQDANSSSERISAEAFSQFADHYYRVHQTILSAIEQKRNSQENKSDLKHKSLDVISSEADNSSEPNNTLVEKDKEHKIHEAQNMEAGFGEESEDVTSVAIEKVSKSDNKEDIQEKADDAVA